MKIFVDAIFASSGFVKKLENESFALFSKGQDASVEEFFIIAYVGMDFFDKPDLYDEILRFFQRCTEISTRLEKNTSVIFCARLDTLVSDVPIIKNKVLLIEEDQFWFKKYVLQYTDNAISVPDGADPVFYFKGLLSDALAYNAFKENPLLNEAYFVAVQIFLKFPFLPVPQFDLAEYRSIDNIIEAKLSVSQQALRLRISELNSSPTLDWEKIKDGCLNPTGQASDLDHLLANLSNDAFS